MAGTNSNAINYFSPAKWVVSKTAGEGTHTTIAGALGVASSLDTIVIMPGTYTEDNTISTAVNICAHTGDANGQVIVNGKFTITSAITVNLSNLELETNSEYVLAVTGSAASVVNLTNCYINASNNTAIDYTSSSSSSSINLYNCSGNLGTTGIGYWTMSSAGEIFISGCSGFYNSGGSTTASSNSAGIVVIEYSVIEGAISTSSTGTISHYFSTFNTSGINTACITLAGTESSNVQMCSFSSGTASALSIGSGTTMTLTNAHINSSNTDAITGAGTLDFTGLTFQEGTTYLVNTTTQSGGTIQGIRAGNAPSAGYLGEQFRSFVNISNLVTLSTNSTSNITSISLTAGIWDVSALICFECTGASTSASAGISTTSATLPGNNSIGDNQVTWQQTNATIITSLAIPSYRMTLSTTTTVYLVANLTFSTNSGYAWGRISGTRVG